MRTGRAYDEAAALAFVASAVLCLLVCVGIYESQVTLMYFDKSIDVTPFVLVTFAASLLAPLPARTLGPRRHLAAFSATLAIATIAATLVHAENIELAASTIGVIAGMWSLAGAVSVRFADDGRLPIGSGVVAALALLLIARAALRTLPLDELPVIESIAIVLVLVAVLAAGAQNVVARATGWSTTDPRGVLACFALPFVLLFSADVALNGAVVAGAAGLAIADRTSSYIGLLAAGCGAALAVVAIHLRVARRWLAVVALAIGGAALWTRVGVAPLAGGALLTLGVVLSAGLLTPAARPARVPLLGPLALAGGWIAAILAALAYYLGVGFIGVLIAMIVVVALATAVSRGPVDALPRRLAIPLAALAIIVPVVAIVTPTAPARSAGTNGHLRVMTYNIHLGYSDGDVPSSPEIAAAIASASPDVVALAEVTRGMSIAGGHDALATLADRLGMSFAFAPMMGDVEGVAILSRSPIDDVRVLPLARSSTARDLTRVLLVVRTGGVVFAATHLAGSDMTTQVRAILDAVASSGPAIVCGDMNSTPATPQMRLFADAGFTDLGAAAGATFSASAPSDHIDYIWARGVAGSGSHVVRTLASDHLPVVADVVVR